MSLFRCGGGGGMLEETVLWTNPSPTSDFAAQSVTLSESLSDFDYIGVTFNATKSTLAYSTVYYKVDEFKLLVDTQTADAFKNAISMGVAQSGNMTFARRFYYVDDTHVYMVACNVVNSSATTKNSLCIPSKISGLKFSNRRPSAVPVATGSFSIGSTDIDIVLGFKPKYICIEYALSNTVISTLVYNEDAASNKQIISGRNGSNASCTIEDCPYTGTSGGRIISFNSDGFTLRKPGTSYGTVGKYFAIG